MDKKYFLNSMKEMDENKVVKLWEDIKLSESIDYPIQTTKFYPPGIWTKLNNINGMTFLTKGLTGESEKKVILIIPKNYLGEIPDFNLVYFKINGKNKFKNLLHKDFLGTIMSLGIRREILGDLIVENNVSYGVIFEENYKIIENIDKISNVPVKVEFAKEEEVPKTNFKKIIITVSSLRLDSVISETMNISRQRAADEIVKGNIMLNYVINKEKSFEIKEGDIISIRKFGKFKLGNEITITKKGKKRISLNKYI
ncbi:RNA-binding protein [Fusobacterium sp. IOR10]|uniref:YlmH family RNA-binding protein n=1 Tax=Fusobacterium sp. IOR10 TaxID=2665157 RepID=UPI0013D39738|nr:YlmH/Sll1252 family protein [Fusobacterium sp. IOR10]